MHEHLHALAIHAYYGGEIEVGRRVSDKLLNLPGLPADIERQARANRTWYTPKLEELCGVEFRGIACDPAHAGWSTFNPTICDATGGDVFAVIRSSNYRIDENGRYVIPEADGQTIRTENILCRITKDGVTVARKILVPPAYEVNGFPVSGLEDIRLNRTDAGWWASATVRDAAGWDGRCRIGVAKLDIDEGRLHSLRILDWEGLQEHEKNWMPIAGRDGWLYAAGHNGRTVTVQADAEMPGVFEVLGHAEAPPMAAGFRGGGQLVPFRGGWLAIVHEVAVMQDGRRAYEHRFVWFDAGFRLARWSPLFAFREQKAIEFAAGLVYRDGWVAVSFGVRDAEAWLAWLQEDELCQLMTPVS